jgi:hypothetical protein
LAESDDTRRTEIIAARVCKKRTFPKSSRGRAQQLFDPPERVLQALEARIESHIFQYGWTNSNHLVDESIEELLPAVFDVLLA